MKHEPLGHGRIYLNKPLPRGPITIKPETLEKLRNEAAIERVPIPGLMVSEAEMNKLMETIERDLTRTVAASPTRAIQNTVDNIRRFIGRQFPKMSRLEVTMRLPPVIRDLPQDESGVTGLIGSPPLAIFKMGFDRTIAVDRDAIEQILKRVFAETIE